MIKYLNKKVTSNKTKHVPVKNGLKELSRKVRIGKLYFTSNGQRYLLCSYLKIKRSIYF